MGQAPGRPRGGGRGAPAQEERPKEIGQRQGERAFRQIHEGHEERACCSGTFQCITGYNPAQDRIVDLWDAQRHELAIEAEEETSREEETAEVATTLHARRS